MVYYGGMFSTSDAHASLEAVPQVIPVMIRAAKALVSLRVFGCEHALGVCDEGSGLPPGFDPDRNGTNPGTKVVTILVQ